MPDAKPTADKQSESLSDVRLDPGELYESWLRMQYYGVLEGELDIVYRLPEAKRLKTSDASERKIAQKFALEMSRNRFDIAVKKGFDDALDENLLRSLKNEKLNEAYLAGILGFFIIVAFFASFASSTVFTFVASIALIITSVRSFTKSKSEGDIEFINGILAAVGVGYAFISSALPPFLNIVAGLPALIYFSHAMSELKVMEDRKLKSSSDHQNFVNSFYEDPRAIFQFSQQILMPLLYDKIADAKKRRDHIASQIQHARNATADPRFDRLSESLQLQLKHKIETFISRKQAVITQLDTYIAELTDYRATVEAKVQAHQEQLEVLQYLDETRALLASADGATTDAEQEVAVQQAHSEQMGDDLAEFITRAHIRLRLETEDEQAALEEELHLFAE